MTPFIYPNWPNIPAANPPLSRANKQKANQAFIAKRLAYSPPASSAGQSALNRRNTLNTASSRKKRQFVAPPPPPHPSLLNRTPNLAANKRAKLARLLAITKLLVTKPNGTRYRKRVRIYGPKPNQNNKKKNNKKPNTRRGTNKSRPNNRRNNAPALW